MVISAWKTALLFLWNAGHTAGQLDGHTPLGFQGDNTTSSCRSACTALVSTLGEKVFYQTLPAELFTGYFTRQQSETRPLYVILPTSAEDVSDAIKIIAQNECIFAIKSGGHAMFAGASNAENGITLDLSQLNGLGISEDREAAFVGTGNRWKHVYNFLDPWNLTVVGGRDEHVGVGGFLLGGGISFLSRRFGWGCGNVRNYEAVLANGSISHISHSTHPDLYWALRGGGNNFGVVTRFDLEKKVLDPMWGGFTATLLSEMNDHLHESGVPRIFSWRPSWFADKAVQFLTQFVCRVGYCRTFDSFADAIVKLTENGRSDPYAQAYGVFGLMPYIHNWAFVFQLNHGQGLPDAPAFGDLITTIKRTSIYSTLRLANLTTFAGEIASMNPVGQRQSYQTATFKFDLELIKDMMRIYTSEFDPIRGAKGLTAAMPMQVITQDEIKHFSKNGGNALGTVEDDGPLLVTEAAVAWASKDDDEAVMHAAQNTIDRSVALAKKRGLHHRFIYQNYAAKHQDVFEGYGPENRKLLREIQHKYDQKGIFARLTPGYFKL